MSKNLLCIIFLLVLVNSAQAAYPLKTMGTAAIKTVKIKEAEINTNNITERQAYFTASSSVIVPDGIKHFNDRSGRFTNGEGTWSLKWAMWGFFLFLPAIGAIFHGIRGLRGWHWNDSHKAGWGFALGIFEIFVWTIALLMFL